MRDSRSSGSFDNVQHGQLIWSCVVAIGLGVAALVHWGTPKSSLLEPERAPAQIRAEVLGGNPLKSAVLLPRR